MSPAFEKSAPPRNPHQTGRQNAANKRNAQHSTGPRTERGKSNVRHNGLKHGLTGQVTVMPWEDHQAHDKFCQDLIADLAPVGIEQALLANTIAEDYWRLNRIKALEQNIYALGCATTELPIGAHPNMRHALLMAQTFLENAKSINLLSLYESRITRTLHKNRAELAALQEFAKVVQPLPSAPANETKEMPADRSAFSKPGPKPQSTPAAPAIAFETAVPEPETTENPEPGGIPLAA